jgi:hypothetical protein
VTLEAGALTVYVTKAEAFYLHFHEDASKVMSTAQDNHYIITMDTQSILKTALAEHEESQINGNTLESLSADVEQNLKDLTTVSSNTGLRLMCRFQHIMNHPNHSR